MDCAFTSNQCELIESLNHFASSGGVFVLSCAPVPAVIRTLQSSQVESAQSQSIERHPDLPMPCPEATAMRSGMWRVAGLFRCSEITALISDCHLYGPAEVSRA